MDRSLIRVIRVVRVNKVTCMDRSKSCEWMAVACLKWAISTSRPDHGSCDAKRTKSKIGGGGGGYHEITLRRLFAQRVKKWGECAGKSG
jgi:hypothetical protein